MACSKTELEQKLTFHTICQGDRRPPKYRKGERGLSTCNQPEQDDEQAHSMPKEMNLTRPPPNGAISDDMAVFEEHSGKQQPLCCLPRNVTQSGSHLRVKAVIYPGHLEQP